MKVGRVTNFLPKKLIKIGNSPQNTRKDIFIMKNLIVGAATISAILFLSYKLSKATAAAIDKMMHI